MGQIDKQAYKREVRGGEVQSKYGYAYVQRWHNPAAASATGVHAAISTATVVTTGITQPDFPRVLSITGAGSGHSATGNVVINGTDIRGATISDTIALNGSTTVNGVKAFATVTSIDLTGISGNDANNTVQIGTSALLGLERMLSEDSVFATTVNGSWEATRPTVSKSTSVISQNTISTNTAPNGSKDIMCAYITKELTTAKRVTA